MFQLENISKRYLHKGREVVALQSTTLHIAAAEFVAVVGPSGSGKTTLLSMLGGMLAPTTGEVHLDGDPLYAAPPRRRAQLRLQKLGFVFQTFNLIPYMSALENVQVPLMLSGLTSDKQVRRASELLARLGLGERLYHKPSELSIGQQQRVALARTLANDPRVILADEPTGNLDPQTREQVLKFLAELCAEGRTVIIVTHDPAASTQALRTIRLAEGAVSHDTRLKAHRVA
jgi:putative ABC transport system ATP-binding protein